MYACANFSYCVNLKLQQQVTNLRRGKHVRVHVLLKLEGGVSLVVSADQVVVVLHACGVNREETGKENK